MCQDKVLEVVVWITETSTGIICDLPFLKPLGASPGNTLEVLPHETKVNGSAQ